MVLRHSGGPPPRGCALRPPGAGLLRVDGMLMRYLVKICAEAGLLVLASTIRFEDVHVLTRQEIVRFGIDRRELAETRWALENVAAAWCTRP